MYFYKVVENGHITVFGSQSFPVTAYSEITEEEYNQLQADFETKQKAIADYTEKVKAGEITLEEVPAEYYAEVEANVNVPEPEALYTLDEAAAIIASEVADNE